MKNHALQLLTGFIAISAMNISFSQGVIDEFPYTCDFDDYNTDWVNVDDDDDFDWLISSDENSYALVSSLSEIEEKQAWLEAIVDLRDVKKADITFIYKIQTLVPLSSTSNRKNIKPGTLQLDINYKGEWKYDLWHNHSSDIKWKKQKIDLSEYCGELIVLSFTGYIEVPETDICLDNITIQDRKEMTKRK